MNLCLNDTLVGCGPIQIISINEAVNDASSVKIYNSCKELIDNSNIEYAYSVDGVCWSCFMPFDDMIESTAAIATDYFIKAKVQSAVSNVTINGQETYDYSTQLYSGFSFNTGCETQSSNVYNPYANMENAVSLQQSLTETVGCMFGIPIYYFSVDGTKNSKDITFKEYALSAVTKVKQIKMIVADGQMPSSKPEFAEWGLDWQSDWETEIPKGMFATAFGKTDQPMEGDFVYVPMMKRMWMVSNAYEEKKDSLMWNATTFKVVLTKYQQDASVDLGDAKDMIDDIVKNKYEDLFGSSENNASGTDAAHLIKYDPNNLYPVYMSDATRKYVTCKNLTINQTSTYYKGTIISDNAYTFTISPEDAQVIYQNKICSDSISSSMIISFQNANVETDILSIGNKKLHIKQTGSTIELSVNIDERLKGTFKVTDFSKWYFISLRWSRELNSSELQVFEYKYPDNIPLYKLNSHHYYYDIDNPILKKNSRWNIEMKCIDDEVSLHGFYGYATNVKVFDYYNDSLSEILMQYPNNSHLQINDTARPLIGLDGVSN